jgi:hypothetical protein
MGASRSFGNLTMNINYDEIDRAAYRHALTDEERGRVYRYFHNPIAMAYDRLSPVLMAVVDDVERATGRNWIAPEEVTNVQRRDSRKN